MDSIHKITYCNIGSRKHRIVLGPVNCDNPRKFILAPVPNRSIYIIIPYFSHLSLFCLMLDSFFVSVHKMAHAKIAHLKLWVLSRPKQTIIDQSSIFIPISFGGALDGFLTVYVFM